MYTCRALEVASRAVFSGGQWLLLNIRADCSLFTSKPARSSALARFGGFMLACSARRAYDLKKLPAQYVEQASIKPPKRARAGLHAYYHEYDKRWSIQQTCILKVVLI
jgi:hypothetical protein